MQQTRTEPNTALERAATIMIVFSDELSEALGGVEGLEEGDVDDESAGDHNM